MNVLNLFCKSIIIIIHTKGILADERPGIIGIYATSDYSSKVEYNITKCNPEVSNTIDGKVYRISPYKNCVNIYQGKNCHGRFVRYIGGSFYNLHTPQGHKWVEDGTLVKEPLLVNSVGPCLDRCDPRNWEGAGGSSPNVTLYSGENFRGHETMVHLNSDDCYVLPKSVGSLWYSLKISGDESNSCVELHKHASCGGNFTQFRPGYPHLHNLNEWGWDGRISAAFARAVSRCGSFCGKIVSPVKGEPLENPGPDVVTFYDHFGYYGNAVNVNLTGGCVDVSIDATLSIRTYGQCVILYGLPGCEERQGYNTLQLGGEMGKDYYIEKFLTLTVPLPPKSLRLCPPVQIVDKVMTEGLPTAAQPEMGHSCVGKLNICEKMVADSFPSWIIYAQPLCWVLFFVGGALFGGLISKRYEKKSSAVNSEKFIVSYKL